MMDKETKQLCIVWHCSDLPGVKSIIVTSFWDGNGNVNLLFLVLCVACEATPPSEESGKKLAEKYIYLNYFSISMQIRCGTINGQLSVAFRTNKYKWKWTM